MLKGFSVRLNDSVSRLPDGEAVFRTRKGYGGQTRTHVFFRFLPTALKVQGRAACFVIELNSEHMKLLTTHETAFYET